MCFGDSMNRFMSSSCAGYQKYAVKVKKLKKKEPDDSEDGIKVNSVIVFYS